MKNILILGSGTAGTIMANRLHRLYRWDVAQGTVRITVVDQDTTHVYQPGLLFIPFGVYQERDVLRPRRRQVAEDVRYIQSAIRSLDATSDTVVLENGDRLSYDVCILATGAHLAPEETEGLLGDEWQKSIFDFYTIEGATALAARLQSWPGGKLVINVVENPIKCPVAPLEFAFLADWFFTMRGMRDKVEITYATPLDGAFTKPICSQRLSYLLERKGINPVTEFNAGSVDTDGMRLLSWDEREVPFDLLVTIPAHKGASFIAGTPGLGNEMNFVFTNKHTAAGAVQSRTCSQSAMPPTCRRRRPARWRTSGGDLTDNVRRFLAGEPLEPAFDGHANCFIETGFDKALLIDFNYEVEPHPGKFPIPVIGPMTLMEESRLNHLGKLAFKWVYWNLLLPGYDIPGIPPQMSMRGKQLVTAAESAA